MATKKVSSERKSWEKLFRACVETIRIQNLSVRSLVKERSFLQDRIKTQYDRWASHVRLLEGHISQMKSQIVMEKLACSIDAAQYDFTFGSKDREALMFKLKLDHAESEIENAKMLMDCLNPKFSSSKSSGGKSLENGEAGSRNGVMRSAKSTKKDELRSKILETEIQSLKQEYENLSLKKAAEVSSLLLEKDFVWNQYKTMETDYTAKLKSEHEAVERANEKIEKLLAATEQLQSLNYEKDVSLVTLTTKLTNMEADANKRNDEILKLSQELKLLKNSKGDLVATPLLNRCTVKRSGPGGKDNDSHSLKTHGYAKKEPSTSRVPDHAKDSEKGGGSLRRKRVDIINIEDTPKLFTSSFKIPKLKSNSSPLVR